LDGCLLGQLLPISVVPQKTTTQIGHGAGDQKILLHETQLLSSHRRVIWIEHPGQRFGFKGSSQRTDEISRAEFLEIEVVRGSGGPQAESVDGLASVPNHWTIKGNSGQGGWPIRNHINLSVPHLEADVQLDFHFLVLPANLPRVTVAQPIVRILLLPSVHK